MQKFPFTLGILALAIAATAGPAAAAGRDSRTRQPAAEGASGIAPLAQSGGQNSRTTPSSGDAKSDTATGSGQRGSTATSGPPVVYMVVPMLVAERDPAKKAGCWAKFHDDPNYRGDNLTLVGPVDMPDMTGPFGIDWKGRISSVETGPKARVVVYDNENYRDLVATFKPGQKVPDVSKRMGFFDEFASLRISCGTSGKMASLESPDLAAMNVPPEILDLQGYVSQTPATASASHGYTADGLRKLAAAIDAAQPRADVAAQPAEDLRRYAEELQSDRSSQEHARIARNAFLSASGAIEEIQRQGFPTLSDQVSELRQSAEAIDPRQPLLEQTDEVKAFLERSSRLLVMLGHARTEAERE